MDVQLPPAPAVGTPSQPQGNMGLHLGQRRAQPESSKPGRSFSSELHAAKQGQREVNRSQSDHEEEAATEPAPDIQALSDRPSERTSCGAHEGKACDDNPERPLEEADSAPSPVVDPVVAQSVLLALLAQPALNNTVAQPVESSAPPEQAPTAVESVMLSVTEDGTSLPATATDSSNLIPGETTPTPVLPTNTATPPPAEAMVPLAADKAGQSVTAPQDEMPSGNQMPPVQSSLPEFPEEQSVIPVKPETEPHDPVKVEVAAQPVLSQKEDRTNSPEYQELAAAPAADQLLAPKEHPPVAMERPAPAPDRPAAQDEAPPRLGAVVSALAQELSHQDGQGGMEWSGREHREHHFDGEPSVFPVVTEAAPAPLPSPSALMMNGIDQKGVTAALASPAAPAAHTASPATPLQPTDWMPGSGASQTKSIMLEVAQTDLGPVNVRVAVNQDIVHTHFSSDRNDMGQYLMNGQEKLQSALQASGLDLGRFQVDIDRQSAGRSFQQPASQGQSQGHGGQGEHPSQGQGREGLSRDNTPRRGLLNLVA